MPRWAKRTGIGVGALIGALILVIVVVLLGANTGPGRALVAKLVPTLTGGTVHVTGLSGHLPGALRIARVTLSDKSGTYLAARGVVLDWEPLRLLGGKVVVDRLAAARVKVLRPPAEQNASTAHTPAHPAKPIPLVVRNLAVADLAIAPALAGHAIALKVTASGARGANGTDALDLDATPLTGGGRYRIEARLSPARVSLNADIEEPEHGLLAGLAGLAGLAVAGPIRVNAELKGPRSDITTRLDASLGPITAEASGRVDLVRRSAELRISASAGAMTPRPGMGWQSVTLHGTANGPFLKPSLRGLLEIRKLTAAGAKVANLTAKLSGSAGEAVVQAELAGVTIPGPDPQLLAEAPVEFDAHMTLDQPGRPLSFDLRHPLINLQGHAETAGERKLAATLTIPDLRPVAAIMGENLAGSATIELKANDLPSGLAISGDSRLALSAAPAPALALLGPEATLKLAGKIHGRTAAVDQFSFIGNGVSLNARGTISEKAAAIRWQAKLPDLGLVNPGVNGSVALDGTIEGPLGAMALAAQARGMLATGRFARQPFHAALNVTGLPHAPAGRLDAGAEIEGAPLHLALNATLRPLQVTIKEASWKSAHAKGTITLGKEAGKGTGEIRFGIANLGDFSALAGQPLAGSAEGTLNAETTGSGEPLLDARLRLASVRYGNVTGSATLSAKGPINALALKVGAEAEAPAPARLTAEALINGAAGDASLSALTLDYRGLAMRLLAPARIVFRPGIEVRGLRLAAAGAELDADGSLSPPFALKLSLRNVTPALIRPFAPGLAIEGHLDATADLAGSLTAPTGRIEAHARGLGLSSELTAGLPPADLALNATISGRAMHLRAELAAGSFTHLRLAGAAPLESTGTLDLGVNGHIDLALLEPVMAASGRHIAGKLALNGTVRGTLASPAIAGQAVLSGGSIADYQSGLLLSRIGGTIEMANGRAELRNFTAHAGPGTIALAGEIGVLEPGMPISLTLTAHNAEPLQSDRITLWLDSDLRLTGSVAERLAIAGTLHVRRAEIEIPKSLPPNIAVLKVVRPGAKPSPPPNSAPNIALDLTLDAPQQIFVRGRGVDAEFGGRIHVSGTTSAPVAVGSLHLIRGAVSLAGQTLTFTSGMIGFNGGDPTDPTLDLVATTSNRATTATLTLGGTVRKPTVTLSSVPDLPQDQVLAALLFGSATSSLSPFQIAEMANALTSLTGTGPSVGNPLGTIRKALGLDQLSVGSDTSGNPTLQAGRYIARGVYVGASQSTSGGGTEAQVKIDLTKRLKLEATTGSGGGSATAINNGPTPDTRNGSSIGLSYQFQY